MRLWQKLLLLPKLESSTEDLNPCRRREGCKLEPQNFQDLKLDTGDLLDGPRSVQNQNVIDCCLIRSYATAVSSSGSVRPGLSRQCCGFKCASLPDSEVVPTPAVVPWPCSQFAQIASPSVIVCISFTSFHSSHGDFFI